MSSAQYIRSQMCRTPRSSEGGRAAVRSALMAQLDTCGHYTSQLWDVKESALEELANMDSVDMVIMRAPPSESAQIALRAALLRKLDLCDHYMSEFRKVTSNVVDELANVDAADMVEAAVSKSSKIVQPLLKSQGITV